MNMKKYLSLAVVLAIAMALVLPATVLAADPPTTFTTNWSGSGLVTGTFTGKNDATYNFTANASAIAGNFSAQINNDNPYSYNVDTSQAYIQSSVGNGFSSFQANRTDSFAPMYGPANQIVYAFIGANGGTAEMATGSWNNYAEMTNGTYGKPKTTNGYNFEASTSGTGANYQILQYVGTGYTGAYTGASTTSDYAVFNALGNGTAKINNMTTGAYGANQVAFGYGGGCYTNANAAFTGTGSFAVTGVGSNQVTSPSAGGWTANGNGTFGSATFNAVATWTNGSASVADFSTSVK
jgi:hypothetical protein